MNFQLTQSTLNNANGAQFEFFKKYIWNLIAINNYKAQAKIEIFCHIKEKSEGRGKNVKFILLIFLMFSELMGLFESTKQLTKLIY